MFRLFGGVRVVDRAGREVPVGPVKRQLVLAALLIDAGQLVTVDALVDRGWGDAPPPQVAGVLRAHLSRIRAQLPPTAGGKRRPGLVRRAGGYLLDVDPDHVDLHRVRSLAIGADDAVDDEQRATLLDRAREVSIGDPLAGLPGAWAEETAASLRREQVALTVAWAGAQLRLGRVGAVVGALGRLVERDRFDEVLGAVFLEALAASGRRAEALAEYGRIREHLLAELGAEPGPELRAVQRRLLEPDGVAPTTRGPARDSAAVAELPPAVHPFRGREADIAALDAARTSATRTVLLTGAGGVGKTALALQWAWRQRARFPDGQLYVDLRGLDPDPVPVGRVLEHFLRVLGVPAADLPPTVEERAAAYRSCLAERRVLVLLDNAASSAQVRPLLPGSPSCLAVVTSRRRLDGLLARDGAARCTVEVLDPATSVDLLETMLSGGPAPSGDDSLQRLAELCGGLPLALRIAAAKVLGDPARSVPALVAELAGAHRLAGLAVEDGDVAVRGAFELSYRALPPAAARAFRLLGFAPATGDGLGEPAIAALLDADDAANREALRGLADAHLIEPRPDGRHDMHDLVRLYARERATSAESGGSADDAVRRLLLYYARRSDAADHVLSRGRPPLPRPSSARGASDAFADEPAALAWWRAEAGTLRALVPLAAERGWDDLTWQLAESQAEVLRREHRVDDLLAVSDTGAAAARRVGEIGAEALLTNTGGIACVLSGRLDDAIDRMQRAAALHQQDGNLGRAGLTRMNVGCARSDQGRYDEARSEFLAALDLLEEAGQPAGVALGLCNLGELQRRCGEYADAERSLRRAIDVGTGTGTERDLAIARENLAAVLAAVDRPDEALDEYARALAAARSSGDRLTESRALTGRGDLLARLGPPAQATSEWRAALQILEAIGSPEAAGVRERLTRR